MFEGGCYGHGEVMDDNLRCSGSPHAIMEKEMNYHFRDPALLEIALTHRSYRFEHKDCAEDNQRLEFLGDAVLGLLLADFVYARFVEHHEGMLTILRSRVVSEPTLAAVARGFSLGKYLRLGRGEDGAGGRDRDALLADALEAVLAAVYLDGGMRSCAIVFEKLFAKQLADLRLDAWGDNAKGRLQHWAQSKLRTQPSYRIVSETGPQHERRFVAEVAIGDQWRAEGEGGSKQAAQTAAALCLLGKLDELDKADLN